MVGWMRFKVAQERRSQETRRPPHTSTEPSILHPFSIHLQKTNHRMQPQQAGTIIIDHHAVKLPQLINSRKFSPLIAPTPRSANSYITTHHTQLVQPTAARADAQTLRLFTPLPSAN